MTWENLFDKPSSTSDSNNGRTTCTKEELRSEFEVFRAGGGSGKSLELCREVLEAVPPSSVQCERDFSVLRLMVGENRTRMCPRTLDDIFVLRKAYEYTTEVF